MSVQDTAQELWGGETRKAVANFPVSGERVPTSVVRWLGHLAGDTLLREAARRIDLEMRVSDIGARFGGDEFAIVLPEGGLPDGERVAHRILESVRGAPVQIDANHTETLSLSIGVAVAQPTHETRDFKLHCRTADGRGGRRALPRQVRRPQSCGRLAQHRCLSLSRPAIEGFPFRNSVPLLTRTTASIPQQYNEERRADQRHDRSHRQLTRACDVLATTSAAASNVPPSNAAAGATMR